MKQKFISHNRLFITTWTFLLILCVGAGVAWAASTPKKGGTLRVGTPTDMTKLDHMASNAVVDGIVLGHVIEPLITWGADLSYVPMIAERWEANEDYTVFTFYLQKGKLFHNGRECVADDVKYSVDRILDPKTKCPILKRWKDFDRTEVIDKYTVRFHMKKPYAGLYSLIANGTAYLGIVPREEYEKQEQAGGITHPIGTGPFKFVEWKPDRYALLERFNQYKPAVGDRDGWGGNRTVYVDKVKFVPMKEQSVSIMALLNKEIDVLQYYPMKYIDKYNKDYKKKGFVLQEVTGMSWYLIYFGNTPLNHDLNFRKAIAYAMDRDVITKAACFGHAKTNPSVLNRITHFRTPVHDMWYPKDVEKAKKLLKDSAYKGEEIEISTTKKYIFMYRQAVALKSELDAVGIKCKLNVLEWPVMMQKWVKGNYQIMSFGMGPGPDPAFAYNYISRMKHFWEKYPQFKELVAKAKATADMEELKKLYEKLHKLQYELIPWILFYNYNYLQAHPDYVKGYETTAFGGYPRAWGVWLDK